jgi:hypothetical protein
MDILLGYYFKNCNKAEVSFFTYLYKVIIPVKVLCKVLLIFHAVHCEPHVRQQLRESVQPVVCILEKTTNS